MAHYEPTHQDLSCLQIQIFSFASTLNAKYLFQLSNFGALLIHSPIDVLDRADCNDLLVDLDLVECREDDGDKFLWLFSDVRT